MSSPNRSTVTLDRANIGRLLGIFGGISFIFSVLLYGWFSEINTAVIAALVVTLVAFTAWAIVSPRTLSRTLRGRQTRHTASSFITAILLFGILTMVYIVAARANIGVDVTASGTFSLSETSLDVVERIPDGQTARIVGFYSSRALELRERDDQFLQSYVTAGDGSIEIEYVDPDENPALAQYFGAVEDGDTVLYMESVDGGIDENTITLVTRENKQERYITSALNRMLNNRVFKVYFEESRSSLSILEETQQGLTIVDNTLRRNGIQTDTLNLLELTRNNEPIPNDASVLVLARPLIPYLAEEVRVIADYMEQGGSLLILADATFSDRFFLEADSAFNTYLFENYGLRALEAIIVDPVSNVQTPLDLIGYATFTEPPVGSRLPDASTFFPIARAIEVSADKPSTVANGRIISTSERSYGEFDVESVIETNSFAFDESTDRIGPLDIAGWAWDEQGNDSKVVLIGDADFAMNGVVETAPQGNIALIIESIVWLSGVDAEISFGFSANPSGIPAIFISGNQLDLIGILIIAVLPLTILGIGLTIWYRRVYA